MTSKHDDTQAEILLYQTDDGTTRVEVRMAGETVWLNQNQMADLFLTTKQNIGQHIRNVFAEGELPPESVVKDFFTTAADGKQYRTKHYSLDVIISVGYRVKSLRGTQFRIWATQQLRSYLVKGFAMDDRRLKEGGNTDRYFDELLERIRDIRTSERMFYRKVADIYATSIDYDPASEMTQLFFATVQNKFHFAITGQTAAELIAKRADVSKPNMGLTNWPGNRIIRKDVTVAKNYLSDDELGLLNLIVDQYLSFAEGQARQKKVMSMTAWIEKLHAFRTEFQRCVCPSARRDPIPSYQRNRSHRTPAVKAAVDSLWEYAVAVICRPDGPELGKGSKPTCLVVDRLVTSPE